MPRPAGTWLLTHGGGEVAADKMGYSASAVLQVGCLFLKIDTL